MDQVLPVDLFSRRLRELTDNPGAIRSSSTIPLIDFYGNAETWVVDTFRSSGGKLEAFVQRIASDGSVRLVLPVEVMAAMTRHHSAGVKVVRRRAARAAVATKRAAGIDPAAALRKHRGKK